MPFRALSFLAFVLVAVPAMGQTTKLYAALNMRGALITRREYKLLDREGQLFSAYALGVKTSANSETTKGIEITFLKNDEVYQTYIDSSELSNLLEWMEKAKDNVKEETIKSEGGGESTTIVRQYIHTSDGLSLSYNASAGVWGIALEDGKRGFADLKDLEAAMKRAVAVLKAMP